MSEWVIAALGIYRAGAVVASVNTRFKADEGTYILDRTKAKLLFTVTDFLDTDYVAMLRSGAPVPALETIVVMRGATPAGTVRGTRSSRPARQSTSTRSSAARPRSRAARSPTSSSRRARPGSRRVRCSPTARASRPTTRGRRSSACAHGDRYLIVNPFFHTFGLKAGILACLITGATIVPHAVFDVDAVMQRVVDERISMLPGAPTIYQSILDHPRVDEFDMSTLRLAVTGAANVPVELVKRMREELSFETIVTGYGLTEATGIATMCRHDDDAETIATTSGRAIPDVEVLVVDDDGKEVARGEPGEVVVRGYNIMRGFVDDPEGTAAAIDDDGWLHTGDVGVMDERGYLRITDRLKDMYIVGGFNAYPAEIENMILAHPAVSQVAVIGIPDARMGEVGCAFVIARPGHEIEPDALIAWCREKMANYKVPRRVEVVDAFPLNSTGKVEKNALRQTVQE